jgi:gamma-glutamyltranspeptidase/glutathione hydrolase
MRRESRRRTACWAALLIAGAGGAFMLSAGAQGTCGDAPKAPWCVAVSGDRSQGWLAQHRSEVMARHGIVATSQPLAAQAGLEILRRGGNAIDAAVATSAVLSVVEPMNVGPAGDLFALIYVARENKVYALNASGTAPSGQTPDRMRSLGYVWDAANWGPGSGMPGAGILTVTVPGSVWGWDEVLRRFGTMTLKETLQPAIDYAEEGFPVSERVARDWRLPRGLPPTKGDPRKCCTEVDPDSIAAWYIDGRPPAAGQIHRNPDLARTFRVLQEQGRDGFYKGEIARALIEKSTALGGTMTLADLASYAGEWVAPATTTYQGNEVFTLPPPAQTWATGEILNILEACVPVWMPGRTLSAMGPASPTYWHLMVEAKKLAFGDLLAHNADPNFAAVPLERLLSKAHARSLCGKVNPARAAATSAGRNVDSGGDTIVLTAADRAGNMVAWVNSLYGSFGSGLTVPGYAVTLHNRGGLFTLDPKSPNLVAPGKRPFNTLSAGFVMRGGRPLMAVTLMGGDMQAQGIAQVLVNVLDHGANLQAASDMARFRHTQVPNVLSLESALFALVGNALQAMGHTVRSVNGESMGGYQAIMFTPDERVPASGRDGERPVGGYYRAGSDHRKDGQAIGF